MQGGSKTPLPFCPPPVTRRHTPQVKTLDAARTSALGDQLMAYELAAERADEIKLLEEGADALREETKTLKSRCDTAHAEAVSLREEAAKLRKELASVRKEASDYRKSRRDGAAELAAARKEAKAAKDDAQLTRAVVQRLEHDMKVAGDDARRNKLLCERVLRESKALRDRLEATPKQDHADLLRRALNTAEMEATKSAWYREAITGKDPSVHCFEAVLQTVRVVLNHEGATSHDAEAALITVQDELQALREEATEREALPDVAGLPVRRVRALVECMTSTLLSENSSLMIAVDAVSTVLDKGEPTAVGALEALGMLRTAVNDLVQTLRWGGMKNAN